MQLGTFGRWMAASMFVIAWAAPVHAQLPGGCSSVDQERNAAYTEAALQALLQGDSARFIGLLREMDSGLSNACRAALNREQPVRVRCTADERGLVLSHYEAMIRSALGGDVQSIFQLYENLEASVSSPCWLALNQPDDPGVRRGCSASELDLMASYAGPTLRATKRALLTGDLSQIFMLGQELTAQLSAECNAAAAQAQQHNPQSPGQPVRLPGVNDHGGGTFSMSGVGACTPSGCMAF